MPTNHPLTLRLPVNLSHIKTVFDERRRKRRIYGPPASGGRAWQEVVRKYLRMLS